MDPGEVADLARARLPVEALGIARLGDRERRVDERLEEGHAPLVVARAHGVAVGAERTHEAREDDRAGVGEDAAHFPRPSHVLAAILLREPEVPVETMAKIVTIDPIGETPGPDEQRFDTDCDRALARSREAREPDRRAALTEQPLAVGAGDLAAVPDHVRRGARVRRVVRDSRQSGGVGA